MIRVLFFTGSFQLGGSEYYLIQLLRRLDRRRFEPVVACFTDRGPLAPAFAALGLPLVRFPVDGSFLRPGSVGSWIRAARWIRRERFDVVQCWSNYPNVFGGLAAIAAGSRAVACALRGVYPSGAIFQDPNPPLERLHHWVARRARRMVVNSAGLRDFVRDVEGVAAERIVVIANGVDDEAFAPDESVRAAARHDLGLAADDLAITYVGRLIREKGCFEAIRGLGGADLDGARLLLVGDGRDEKALRDEAASRGVADRVRFLGLRADVAAILNATDVFLLPSHREGCPNALLEAMAAGRPIVATDAIGIRDLLRDDEDSLLVPVGDSDAVAAAIRRLAADPALRARLGRAARERAKTFRFVDSVARFERLYEELAEE